MKMRFKDVPLGCRISYKPGKGRAQFTGTKVEVDIAHDTVHHSFMYNILPDEIVRVVFKSTWRVRCLVVERYVGRALVPVYKRLLELTFYPARWIHNFACRGLNFAEKDALFNEAEPFMNRAQYVKMQAEYDAVFNTRTPDLTTVKPSSTGLVGRDGLVPFLLLLVFLCGCARHTLPPTSVAPCSVVGSDEGCRIILPRPDTDPPCKAGEHAVPIQYTTYPGQDGHYCVKDDVLLQSRGIQPPPDHTLTPQIVHDAAFCRTLPDAQQSTCLLNLLSPVAQ
jgi:hypothetical protein